MTNGLTGLKITVLEFPKGVVSGGRKVILFEVHRFSKNEKTSVAISRNDG